MRTVKVNILNRDSIKHVIYDLRSERERAKKTTEMFLHIFCKRAVKVCRTNISGYNPMYASNLTVAVSYEVWGNGRARVFVKNAAGIGALFFEYGTGPAGAAIPHPDPPAGWTYGKGWYTQAGGKDMETMYGWKNLAADGEDPFYFSVGQPSHPFWYDTVQEITSTKFIDACWAEAKKRA